MTGDTSRQALRAPLTRAPRSMAQRLTLALTLLAVAVFVAVALLLHSGLQQEVERARDHDLEGKIDVVEHLLEEVRVPADVPALTHHLNDVLIGHGQMRIWLLDRDGRVLYGGSAPPRCRRLRADWKSAGRTACRCRRVKSRLRTIPSWANKN